MKFGIACAALVAKASSILLAEAAPPPRSNNDKQQKDETDEGSRLGKNFVSHHGHSLEEGKGTRIRQLLREQAGDHQQSSQTPNDDEERSTSTSTSNKRKSGRLMNLPPKSKEQTKRKLQGVTSCLAPLYNPCPDQQVPVCTKHTKSATDIHFHSDCLDPTMPLKSDREFENCGCCPFHEEETSKSPKTAKSLSSYCTECKTGTNQEILDWCGMLAPGQRCCVDPLVGDGVTPRDSVCNFPGENTELCFSSCVGSKACVDWSNNADSTIRIGIGACSGKGYSCYRIGNKDGVPVDVEIKDGACSSDFLSCQALGGGGATKIVVDEDACRYSFACRLSGIWSDYIRIQKSSCVGYTSCDFMANQALDVTSLIVGENSCNCPDGGGACCASLASDFIGKNLEIANGICNGNGKPCNTCGLIYAGNTMELKCEEQCQDVFPYTFNPNAVCV